jgi:hypothetical protein
MEELSKHGAEDDILIQEEESRRKMKRTAKRGIL